MENWKLGNHPTVIVTDNSEGFDKRHTDKKSIEYYGGVLVCESILRRKDAALISAAPDLLKALKMAKDELIENGYENQSYTIKNIDKAIKKATKF